MSKVISFSVSDEERDFFVEYGKRRGMTISALAKMSLFAYEAAHRFKGLDLISYTGLAAKSAHGPISADGGDSKATH